MKAKVENHFPHATDEEVRRIVHWVLDRLDVNRPTLRVRVYEAPSIRHHGRIVIRAKTQFINARIPETPSGWHQVPVRGGPPAINCWDWEESLVCIMAHEGEHLRQWFARPKGKRGHPRQAHLRRLRSGKLVHVERSWIRPRVFDEAASEWAEYRLLERWRKERR